jgi:rhamnosyltransferase
VISRAVSILLSSYNGARFLAEQIESIRRQTYTDWTLLVRDDGSSDETVWMVESLAALDSRISLLVDQRGNLGPAASFGVLLEHARGAGARYVALADQDDVWFPGKLAREMDQMLAWERKAGEAMPVLVHTDLTVVRDDLSVVHDSFFAFQDLKHPSDWPLGTLLIQNFVTGCTTLINRALLEVAVPLPGVIMHDWWLALCAAASGQVLCLPESTVRYRQHGENAQGSQGWRSALLEAFRRPGAWWRESGALFQRAVEQAKELRHRIERQAPLNPVVRSSLPVLNEFGSAFDHGTAIERLRAVYRHRIRPHTLLPYPVLFYLRVALWSGTTLAGTPTFRHEPEAERGRKRRAPA